MHTKLIATAFLLLSVAAWSGARAYAQTDIAGSIIGAFNETTIWNRITQSPSDSAGGLLEVRHITNSLVGFEATYSYYRANQVYFYNTPVGLPCTQTAGCYTQPIAAVSANAHTIAGDWVLSRKIRNFRPFALAGGGLLLVIPSGGQSTTQNAAEFTFIFGAGLDWKLSKHLGLRLQDRIAIYKTPILAAPGIYPNIGKNQVSISSNWDYPQVYTYSQQPALGIYYRF